MSNRNAAIASRPVMGRSAFACAKLLGRHRLAAQREDEGDPGGGSA